MVLFSEDLPEGFDRAETEFSDNEAITRRAEDPEGELAKLLEWGRLLGYNVVFEPSPETAEIPQIIGINSTASLYETADGASQSLAEAVRIAEEIDWAPSHPGFNDLVVLTIERPDLADEIVWLRIVGNLISGDPSMGVLTDDFALVRVGSARGQVRVAALSEDAAAADVLLAQVEEFVARQAERMRAAQ